MDEPAWDEWGNPMNDAADRLDDPDCQCGHRASEHGQNFGGRCYYDGKAAGRCGCRELTVAK
jgi:hypothetical protein